MIDKLKRWASREIVLPIVSRPSGILAYHRVAELAVDPQALAITPKHFAEIVTVRPSWVAYLQDITT